MIKPCSTTNTYSRNFQLQFLGHGIKLENSKMAPIVDMRAPQNVTELRSLMGSINQLSKFSNRLADISKLIRDLLRRNRQWVWDANHDTALTSLKKVVGTAPTVALHDPRKPIQLSADSSSYGLGATLKQLQDYTKWRPVSMRLVHCQTSKQDTHKSKRKY